MGISMHLKAVAALVIFAQLLGAVHAGPNSDRLDDGTPVPPGTDCVPPRSAAGGLPMVRIVEDGYVWTIVAHWAKPIGVSFAPLMAWHLMLIGDRLKHAFAQLRHPFFLIQVELRSWHWQEVVRVLGR